MDSGTFATRFTKIFKLEQIASTPVSDFSEEASEFQIRLLKTLSQKEVQNRFCRTF
jgi:hypothetical protein